MDSITVELVKAVRDHAMKNYEGPEGWDYVIECWESSEIADEIKDCKTAEEAIARMRAAIAPLNERRDEVLAISGEYKRDENGVWQQIK
jgi:hypothetical protein